MLKLPKKQHFFYISISVLIIVLSAVIVFFNKKDYQNQTGWKNVSNAKFNFSFTIPESFRIERCQKDENKSCDEEDETQIFSPNGNTQIQILSDFPSGNDEELSKEEIKEGGEVKARVFGNDLPVQQYFNVKRSQYEFFITTNPIPLANGIAIIKGHYKNLEDAKVITKIISSFKSKKDKMSSSSIELPINKSIDIKLKEEKDSNGQNVNQIIKIDDNKWQISPLFKVSFYEKLPSEITENQFVNALDDQAATGHFYDPTSVEEINDLQFSKYLIYHNPLNASSKSGRYDPKSSSIITVSCIHELTDKNGFIVFEPYGAVPGGSDACQFLKDGVIKLSIN